jgi:hypothetical protein
MWCIPPKQNADFVAKMEDILDVYALPYDEKYPVVCLYEKPYQLLGDSREPLPVRPGSPEKIDGEYERNGTSSIFVMTEPLKGWYRAHAREHRTAVDFAYEIADLVECRPNVEKIRLVMDNLNTHAVSSLYKAFAPKKARAIAEKLEIHFTPKHGSWLNIAEIAISLLSRQCIDKRIPDIDKLNREIASWETFINSKRKPVNWQFASSDARVKLMSLYPVV